MIPENRMKDRERERERRSGSPWIKAESPERSRATDCHILVVRSRRKQEAEEGKLRELKEEGREGAEGGQTQKAAGNPPVCIQSEGRSVSMCWKTRELREEGEKRRRRRW